jgi:ABC-type multidrug transport system ATPase subunit/pSer/pThr/pTyr-binding forkhead associated (FHA) protein
MVWYVHIGDRRVILAPGVAYTVGRDADCDIVAADSNRVSRHHLTIEVSEEPLQWTVTDISVNGSASADGLFVSSSGNDPLCLQLGGTEGPRLLLTRSRDANLEDWPPPVWPERQMPEPLVNAVTRFGRAPDNDIVIDSLLASNHHAHVVRDETTLTIIDLASARGTFVNGQRVQRHDLRLGDAVTMGGQVFRVEADGHLGRVSLASGISMRIRDVSVRAGSVTLLHDVDLDVGPRSLTAVVGPSGSGKSTLLGALTGLRPADRGQVLLDGQDLYSSYADWRYRIGFVPQQDLVPPQLSVREALTYAARLRFPSDTSSAERAARIDEVLRELKLTDRADLRIDRLSGGQRKRVSVALELLTKPPILYLDEPTSGLDPGLDQQLMLLLRELADDGRSVVVVTHAMDNLNVCDNVLVLAAGGYVAYYGPPRDAPAYFGAEDWPGLFLALEGRPGRDWAQRFAAHLANGERPLPGEESRQPANRLPPTRSDGGLRQLPTLVARTWRVTVSDRTYLALLVALPLVLAGLGFLVGSAAGLGPGDPPTGLNPDARILILILILGATFTGSATSIQEFVKERVIYQRERAVGLSRVSYVLSKAIVLGIIAALQGAVFATLTLAGRPGPQDSLLLGWGTGEIVIIISLLAVTSCMLGLALSAVLPSRESTLQALVIVTMLQIVLSGAIPLRWPSIDNVVGLAIPAAWAFKACAALTDLDALLGPAAEQDWEATTSVVTTSLMVLAGMAVVFIVAAIALLRRSDPGRR